VEHLRQLLTEDHRYVFTLIQKFHVGKGQVFPMLSDRKDVIVITDEAHRSQYDIFALNMRNALPNAAFLGFTGTPLIEGEESKTREVFGDYVSEYNFAQSIEDGATVPLFYENRIPELQLTNLGLNQDMQELLEQAELDEEQERRLEREFAREYHLITREDRLDAVSQDIVKHFINRGHRGKAMAICIDKATAVRMHDKVKAEFAGRLKEMKAFLPKASEHQREGLKIKINEVEGLDMAVVVSQSQNEIAELTAKGLDIKPHRKRMVNDNLEDKFKDPDDPFKLVFVCAMWITGFDVPTCSTIYLDKPMRNHTLMQTIARANRVAPGKAAGLIVDYVGIFKNLQTALAIYARPSEGGDDQPIKNKQELVDFLEDAVRELTAFCNELGIDCEAIKAASSFERIALLDDALEALIADEATKKTFMQQAYTIARVFRAILPDPIGQGVAPDVTLFCVLAEKIKSLTPPPDISHVLDQVEELLDASIAADGYRIKAATGQSTDQLIDLSGIDFEGLAAKFKKGRKRTEAEKLKALIEGKLKTMVRQNRSRLDYLEKFQEMIEDYNAGSKNIEELFEELMEFVKNLNQEDQRAVREQLSEEELAIFDILTKPKPELNDKEKAEVKRVVRQLLETLKREKLVLDWRKRQTSRAAVKQAIGQVLDDGLPEVYDEDLYNQKCQLTYLHIFDSYQGPGASAYAGIA
jgi:type I restriction enzyme R subunit